MLQFTQSKYIFNPDHYFPNKMTLNVREKWHRNLEHLEIYLRISWIFL
jgi:hypothetical protein